MAVNIRSNFLDFFTEGKLPELQAIIEAMQESYPSMRPILFNESNMTTDIAQTTTMSGLRNPERVLERAAIPFQDLKPGFDKTFTAFKIGTAFSVSREMKRDGKVDFVNRGMTSLPKGFFEVKEYDAASVFDDGFTVNQYDGVPLFSRSHPIENGAGSFGINTPASNSELSISSYRELRNILQDTVNENGQLVKYTAKYFVVPQALQDVAAEILKSSYHPENANNAINTVYEHTTLLPGGFWNYLSSDTAFFMVCDQMQNGLHFKYRDPFETDTEYDKYTQAHDFFATERYDFGVASWRGTVGNAGV